MSCAPLFWKVIGVYVMTMTKVSVRRPRGAQCSGQVNRGVVPLDKLDEPSPLLALKTLVAQRLPPVKLPELLLEVQTCVGGPNLDLLCLGLRPRQ
jgi:hypothetical protein